MRSKKPVLITAGISLLALVTFAVGTKDEDTARLSVSAPSASVLSSEPPGVLALVTKVVDGDTIKVSIGNAAYTVRYIGIDTPETVHPSKPTQWMGLEASKENTRLVSNKYVRLEKDVSETDRFGRLLRYVWVEDFSDEFDGDWLLVNEYLVLKGFAQVSTYPPDVKFQERLLRAQQAAVKDNVGLWAPTAAPSSSLRPPTPTPIASLPPVEVTSSPVSKCHPSYDPCLPIVDDMNCPDVVAIGAAPVRVRGSDPYRLDGDHNGVGC